MGKNLDVSIFLNQQLVPASLYAYIIKKNKVTRQSQILNLMTFAKDFQTTNPMFEEVMDLKLAALVNEYLALLHKHQKTVC